MAALDELGSSSLIQYDLSRFLANKGWWQSDRLDAKTLTKPDQTVFFAQESPKTD
jgi:hypothetical protein